MIEGLGIFGGRLLEIIYPKRCLFCDTVLPFGEQERLCEGCRQEEHWLEQDLCIKCGKPLEAHRLELCFDCSKREHSFQAGRAMWLYQGSVSKAIHRYKYCNRKGYAKAFAEALAEYYQKNICWDIDIVTSVPLHPEKLRERSFNQSALLADKFSKEIGVGVNNELLRRVKNTSAQKDLSDIERIHNVNDAFLLNHAFSCKDLNVLIIDDIYTTGSTIDNCAKVLKYEGVKQVYFLTLAIGKGL